MTTITITSARDFKEFIETTERMKSITNINGVAFSNGYPILEASRKTASWYNSADSSNNYFTFPLTITVLNDEAQDEKDLINWSALSLTITGNSENLRKNRIPAKYQEQVGIFTSAMRSAINELNELSR